MCSLVANFDPSISRSARYQDIRQENISCEGISRKPLNIAVIPRTFPISSVIITHILNKNTGHRPLTVPQAYLGSDRCSHSIFEQYHRNVDWGKQGARYRDWYLHIEKRLRAWADNWTFISNQSATDLKIPRLVCRTSNACIKSKENAVQQTSKWWALSYNITDHYQIPKNTFHQRNVISQSRKEMSHFFTALLS